LLIPIGITRFLFSGVLAIPSGHTGNDLGMTRIQNFGAVGVAAVSFSDHDFANGSAVSVLLAPFDDYVSIKYQSREVFLGSLAEGLSLFRGVYARKANFVLLAVGVENGDGVTVRYTDYSSLYEFPSLS
jgi:hypothetical protein